MAVEMFDFRSDEGEINVSMNQTKAVIFGN